MYNFPHKKTFTLIEMLIVVVIIGILAGVLVPRLVGAKERANDSSRLVKVGQLDTAVELYAQDNGGVYPIAPLTTTGTSVATIANKISPYLSSVPTDPGKGTVAILGASGNIQVTGDSFAYYTNTGGTMYAITALMESKKGNTTNAIGEINSDKQGGYQVVGKGLTTNIVAGGGSSVDTSKPGVYHVGGEIIVTDGNNTYTLMDKNLGASEAGTGDTSYGFHFQRGNNYGFPINAPTYGVSSSSITRVQNPIAPYNSSTFIFADQDWASPNSDNMRVEKTQGPCSSEYHVPTYTERNGLITILRSIYSGIDSDGTLLMNTLLLPMAGYRSFGSSSSVDFPGNDGNYRSSTSNVDVYAHRLRFFPTGVQPNYSDYRSYGFSVRCFKNSPL